MFSFEYHCTNGEAGVFLANWWIPTLGIVEFDGKFFQSWSAFSDQLSCNPWWSTSSTLSFFQSNIGFKLHKNAKLSQTVLKSGIVCNWLVMKTRDPNIYHVVLDRSFVMLEGLHKRGDIQNRETIPGIPYICHFFLHGQNFLVNKIYTKKTRKLWQNTQKIANFFALLRQNTQ